MRHAIARHPVDGHGPALTLQKRASVWVVSGNTHRLVREMTASSGAAVGHVPCSVPVSGPERFSTPTGHTMRTATIPVCLITIALLAGPGCNDDERGAPHAPHPRTSHSEPQPVSPSKPEPQAKVSGAPSDTATPALPGEPGGPAPAKTVVNNKVKGSPGGAAEGTIPQDTHPVPPDKTPTGGKDATP
jgi:hypothetical protein